MPVHGAFALPAILLALTPFHSSAKPLPPPVQKQLKAGGFWHRGCPVAAVGPAAADRLAPRLRRADAHRPADREPGAVRPFARAFRKLHGLHFPIRHMRLADFYGPRRGRPREVT